MGLGQHFQFYAYTAQCISFRARKVLDLNKMSVLHLLYFLFSSMWLLLTCMADQYRLSVALWKFRSYHLCFILFKQFHNPFPFFTTNLVLLFVTYTCIKLRYINHHSILLVFSKKLRFTLIFRIMNADVNDSIKSFTAV